MLDPGCCKRSCAGTSGGNGLPAETAADDLAATNGDPVSEAETCEQEANGKDSAGADKASAEPARCTCREGERTGNGRASDEPARCTCRERGKIGNGTSFSGSARRNGPGRKKAEYPRKEKHQQHGYQRKNGKRKHS